MRPIFFITILSFFLVATHPVVSNRHENLAPKNDTVACEREITRDDSTDQLAALLNQPENNDTCLFVGCNSFF